MKKFGTPTWAAPGWARENVGLAAAGDPLLLVIGATGGGFALRFLAFGGFAVGHGTGFARVLGRAFDFRLADVLVRGVTTGQWTAGGLGLGVVLVVGGAAGVVGVVSTVIGGAIVVVSVVGWAVVVPSVLAGVVGAASGVLDVVVVAAVFCASPGVSVPPAGPASTPAASSTRRRRRRVMVGLWALPLARARDS
jgi:hypothetical protein